ncbi:MAG: histidinol dehydrogenase [Aureispira sp.]|nr:histidinol dehydrogenase [Aureispira sp.]
MQTYNNPDRSEWKQILRRPTLNNNNLEATVQVILDTVKKDGDQALFSYSKQFDKVDLSNLNVTDLEIQEANQQVSQQLKDAIQIAYDNIYKFHSSQQSDSQRIETMQGIECWRKNVPISKVGLYIPGGTAPLFSTVMMLGIPAKIAGCQEIVLCTPPQKDGSINPVILYTAKLVGCTKIFKVGGAQAIAAMTYGTESIPKVYKLFGPGNQYVTKAKQLAQQAGTAIDMPAGPSELLVLADDEANPDFVAADLLSQAEHGVDSQVVLVAYSPELVKKVKQSIQEQLTQLPRKTIAQAALENSSAIVVKNEKEAIEFINEYAPEHLILNCQDAEELAQQVENAGSVFLGAYTPESAGDYASGTNHTLPTNGFAKTYSGVSLDSFVKKITFQQISPRGLKNIGNAIELMAEAEQLIAHKNAVSIRLQKLNKSNI